MFHVKHEAWTRSADRLGVRLSLAQAAALEAYESLLAERAIPLGIVAAGDRDNIRDRHILDSVRAAPFLGGPEGDTADLGSGAGLPGIPLAIVRPDLGFRLVDVRRRRVAFMELVVDTLGLINVAVEQRSVETLAETFPVCLARALAEPRKAWVLADRVLRPGGRLLYWAGKRFEPRSETPGGVTVSVRVTPGLADAGPIVIMTRQ
jgi:16S rRNA (guanine527-N7)-methyltransferase